MTNKLVLPCDVNSDDVVDLRTDAGRLWMCVTHDHRSANVCLSSANVLNLIQFLSQGGKVPVDPEMVEFVQSVRDALEKRDAAEAAVEKARGHLQAYLTQSQLL